MFDRLKNLFRKRAEEESPAKPEQSTLAPRAFQPGYTPGGGSTAGPPPAQAGPAAASQTDELESSQPTTGDSIRILLKPVLLKLPDVLKARVRQPPAGPVQISIPLQKVLTQLPQGSVRISFGELRQASPAGVFNDTNDQDQTPVGLPLPEILAQLKPDQLPRRAAQRKTEIPDEISGIFGPKGHSETTVRMGSASARAPAPPAPTAPAAPEPVRGPRSAPAAPPKPAWEPVAPIKPIAPLPLQPIRPSSPLPAPSAVRPQTSPAAPARSAPISPLSVHAAPIPMPAPPAPTAPPEPREPLVVSLSQLAGSWPDAIKQACAELSDATVALPPEELEQGLKRGRILLTWKRIRSLINPALPPFEPGALDDTQLELPLPVIAPLFMAHKRPAVSQRKYAVADQIPDLFTAKGVAPSAQAQVAAPATAPAAPTIARPGAPVSPPAAGRAPAPAPAAPAVVAPPPPQEIGEVFGQPGRKNWTPSEIVQKTGALRGVGGALIAMQDGLLVAGHLPPGLNPETIAAFMPQMFSRMLQYSKELKFGEASNLTIIVDNVPLKIFKVGGVFFTVLGRAEEPLPEPHLSIIAAQLAPQSK